MHYEFNLVSHNNAGDVAAARDAWHRALTILNDLHLPEAESVRASLESLDQAAFASRTRA